jgi:2-polyprenyl-3-methyl-5-hydroxy-6-metoxy-1,4-benzoquinol methylase
MEMNQKINCPICDTSVDSSNFLESYISPYNKQEYKLYECSNCLLQWWEPLKMLKELYKNIVLDCADFYISTQQLSEKHLQKISENHNFFKYFPKEVNGRLLDVSCGSGNFIYCANKIRGFEVWGVDLSKEYVNKAKRDFKIETIFAMSLEEFYYYAKERNLKFDAITFFEVLEHQDKPKEFLEMVRNLLKEGGWIAGSVPNRIISRFLWSDYPPHHFLRFSKQALEKALLLNGFSEVKIYPTNFPFEVAFPYAEKKLFGDLLLRLRSEVKAMLFRNNRRQKREISRNSERINRNESKIFLLRILKLIDRKLTKLILFPFALGYFGKLRKNGLSLYFQAKKTNL